MIRLLVPLLLFVPFVATAEVDTEAKFAKYR